MGLLVGWPLALAVIVLFASLGRWQLARMHEKQAKLDAAAQALGNHVPQPLLLASDPKRAGAYDWPALVCSIQRDICGRSGGGDAGPAILGAPIPPGSG